MSGVSGNFRSCKRSEATYAMGCQKDICAKITGKKSDYVISLKGNQSKLHDNVKDIMENVADGKFCEKYKITKTERKVEVDHGRIESREYFLCTELSWPEQKDEWAGLRGIGYDKWQSRDVIDGVEAERPDIALIEVEQSLRKLSPLTQAYEKQVKDGLLVDNSPVMLWMMNNVEIKPDANGNYKPMKKSKGSNQRIDGVISSIMAYGISGNEIFSFPDLSVHGRLHFRPICNAFF